MKDDITPKRAHSGSTHTKTSNERNPRTLPEPQFEEPSIHEVEDKVIPPDNPSSTKKIVSIMKAPKHFWNRKNKKQKLLLTAGIGLGLVLSIGGLLYVFWPSPPPPEPAPVAVVEETPQPPPEPETATSPLTGLEVEPALAKRPVTGVIIENSPEARPQSGLSKAGIVFESRVEGGITRFLALYQEQSPEKIGPIRSVRRNHIDFLLGFDAAIAHVGGSGQALARIRNENVKDLDQFQNPEAYARSNARYAPHNMYSSREKLLQVHEKKGYTSSSYDSFVRKTPKPLKTPDVTSINASISSPLYNSRFEYDKATNSYKRFLAGAPHIDELTNTQIQPDVVIALVADYRRDGIYSAYTTTGSNSAYIFQDGTVTKGIWEKPTTTSNFRFGDANGLPIGINPGKTWIVLVRQGNEIRY